MNDTIGYLICETASVELSNSKIISEENGVPEIEAILQDADVRNRNGRFYDRSDIFPQLESIRLLELIKTGNLYGEAGHPTSKDISRQQTIDPSNMSHLIKKLWTEGSDIKGRIVPAATRVGDDFKRVIESGTSPSFSLRALGSIKETARGSEVKNIKIVTWDWVVFPSHKRAYMQSMVNIAESVMSNNTNHLFCEDSDSGLLVPLNSKKVIEYIKESSANIKNIQESFEFMYDSIVVDESGKSVVLTDKEGTVIGVRLENYISNEIMNYCSKF